MKLRDITGDFEKKRVIMYNADQTKAVYHNVSMRHMKDNIYLGEPDRDSWGNHHVAVFVWFEAEKVGIMLCVLNEDYTDQDVIREVNKNHLDSVTHYIESAKARIEAGLWFKLPEVELISVLSPDLVEQVMDSRRRWKEALDAKKAEARREHEEKEAAFIKAQNAEAQAIIDRAISAIRNGGKLENEGFTIYGNDRCDCKGYCVVAYLMDACGIKLPIRTRGWINNSLATVTIKEDGKIDGCQYYKRGNSKGSTAVWAYLNSMVDAVRSGNIKPVSAAS